LFLYATMPPKTTSTQAEIIMLRTILPQNEALNCYRAQDAAAFPYIGIINANIYTDEVQLNTLKSFSTIAIGISDSPSARLENCAIQIWNFHFNVVNRRSQNHEANSF